MRTHKIGGQFFIMRWILLFLYRCELPVLIIINDAFRIVGACRL